MLSQIKSEVENLLCPLRIEQKSAPSHLAAVGQVSQNILKEKTQTPVPDSSRIKNKSDEELCLNMTVFISYFENEF